LFQLGALFVKRKTSQKMVLCSIVHTKYMKKFYFSVNDLFLVSELENLKKTSGTKNVSHEERHLNPKVSSFFNIL
jgi:hypothetical protein